MPQLGETVTEGTIIRWLKAVGDPVAQDEPLFEVSTDKVDSEVPSPASGVLTEILVQEGETVDVGARLAVIGEAAAPPAAPPAAAPPPVAAPAAPPPPPVAVPAAPPPAPVAAPAAPPPVAAPAAPPPPPVAVPAAGAPPAPVAVREEGPTGTQGALLSPVVRKLVRDNNLDPALIPGTGLGGRITRDDVQRYLAAMRAPAPTPAPAPAPSAPAVPAMPVVIAEPAARPATMLSVPPAPPGARDEIVPFSTIRRVTAEHMVRSKATSAHTLVAMEVDFEQIDRVRARRKAAFKEAEGVNLTYLPFVARAVIDVLRDYPHLNASVGNDALVVHRDVHLGFAVDLAQQGLIVPVIHHADGQSLRGLARSIADLADRARTRRLSADDIAGGTFTITNPGPFGTYLSVPIIAQPQVAILSTDGVKRRPVVVTTADGTESIAIHSVGILALSFDHRAVDGAYASAFLRDLACMLETRDWDAEL